MEKSSKTVLLPLLLFEFIGNKCGAGVGTLGSIFKPPLPDSLSESVLLVHSWITSNEQLTIRWHKKTKNNWNDKIYGNDPIEGPEDEFRVGRVVMISEDKDFLKKNLHQVKKKTGPVKDVLDALKNAVAYGSTANTDHNLNLMINAILDSFVKQSELADFSLSGKPCPNVKGSKAKPKISPQIMQALKNFIRRSWKEWYQVIPTDKAINSGVGAKLRSCHTAAKKQKKRSAHVTLSPIAEGQNPGDDDIDRNKENTCENFENDEEDIDDPSPSIEEASSADEHEN